VPHYRLFYPFSEDVLSKLVYFFERDDSPKFPYVEGVKREVREWQKAYELSSARKERSSLSWTEEGGEIVIDDRRAGFPRRRYRLADHAAAVFHAMDRPTTLEAAAKYAPAEDAPEKNGNRSKPPWRWPEEVISFTPGEFAREPARCLAPLVLGGILYVEDDWYLALPVARESHRPSSTIRRWHTTTVGIEAMRATPWWFVS
jgi:hypothetical protein